MRIATTKLQISHRKIAEAKAVLQWMILLKRIVVRGIVGSGILNY
jgi:hypothetical protein